MARRKNGNEDFSNIPAKAMRRKKPINSDHLVDIKPLTENQQKVFDAYAKNKNLFLCGAAGTGKSFITIYLALKEILSANTPYEKLYIVRSLVPTREIGFLPGTHDDKSNLYQIPYKNMVRFMFKMPNDDAFENLYNNLKTQETISFWSTSFLRGTTLDNAIILIDEFSNLNFHELDSIITRVGVDSKIIFCGDTEQSDLIRENERNGSYDFMKIINAMSSFEMIEFGVQDIVRSGIVREYLITKHSMGIRYR
jgi:phosphate starvation-inducible protein PhoH and related proteins